MIEAIRKLSIKGKCFLESTIFPLYSKNEERIALIYGKNGSGKSTLSKGIYIASHKTEESDLVALLIDKDDKSIDFSNSNNVFVFNEDYIENRRKNALLPDKDLLKIIQSVMRRMDRGESTAIIADKLNLDSTLVEQIIRLRVTHPSVNADGIMNKMVDKKG